MSKEENELMIDSLMGTINVLNDSIFNYEESIFMGKEVTDLDKVDYRCWNDHKFKLLIIIEKLKKEEVK